MVDEGSVMQAELGAAGEAPASYSEWFCSWDTVEGLARDAHRLYDRCGTNCSIKELTQWRERVIAQLHSVLDDEERIFAALKRQLESPAEGVGAAMLVAAANG